MVGAVLAPVNVIGLGGYSRRFQGLEVGDRQFRHILVIGGPLPGIAGIGGIQAVLVSGPAACPRYHALRELSRKIMVGQHRVQGDVSQRHNCAPEYDKPFFEA